MMTRLHASFLYEHIYELAESGFNWNSNSVRYAQNKTAMVRVSAAAL